MSKTITPNQYHQLLDLARELGSKAGKASKQGDQGMVSHARRLWQRSLLPDHGTIERRSLEAEFAEAYRKASGFYNKPIL